ncbi:unnamed protein product [Closterium sp. Yama58-4]|nr:unnamed protein product [Closterium sp. Yama58-4]
MFVPGMAETPPPQSSQDPIDSISDMDGKRPIASRRGTKLLAIPLPDPPPGTSFDFFHRSARTPARTPAESNPAAGSSSTCRRASPRLPRDVAVALTPTLSSSPQPRAKPHHAAPHPPPRRPSALDAGADSSLEATGTTAPCRRPARHAPLSPCCKLHWRRVVVVSLLLLSFALFLLMLPALWLAHAWPLPSLPSVTVAPRESIPSARFKAFEVGLGGPLSLFMRRPWLAARASPESLLTPGLPLSHLKRHVSADFFVPRVGSGAISRPAAHPLSLLRSWLRWNRGEAGSESIPENAGANAPAPLSGGGDSDVITDPHSGGDGDGICVAIPSSPRSFPHRELPPWHFPVSLLKSLDERHSRRNSAHRGKQLGGLGEMHAVVYSAGCKASVPAALAANRRQRMGRLRRIGAAKSVEDMEADFVVEDTKRANEMVGVYTREIERAAQGLSMRVDVLRAHEDVCRFIGQEEGELRRGGVEDKVVGKEGWESWKWRTKLVMDFVYVARQCLATRPKYVLLLQDDTLPAKLYDVGIEKFVSEDLAHKSWAVVSLYNPQSYNWKHQHGDEYSVPCCAQALLFNVTALEGILQYMEAHFMETNMDLLVNKYLIVSGVKGYVHLPSLFQHLGSRYNYSVMAPCAMPPRLFVLVVALVAAVALLSPPVVRAGINRVTVIDSSQLAVLRALSKEWGRGFNYSRAWSSKQPPKRCMAYPGIICNDKGIIVGLNVSNTNINGTIKGVSALTALALLDMSQNPIKDVAPLAPLTNLVYLNLEALGIEKAPNALGNLGMLKHLNLNQNYLSTPIPPFVTALTALTLLDLGFNDFSGSLPPGFGNLKSLKKLVLSHGGDALGGKLPRSFSSLTNLRELYMNDNAFGGSIPAYIGSFLSLSYLRLSNNMFSGTIPKELSRLKSLQFLGLRYNWLTGSIPAALASLSQLTYLSLNYNKLSGSIPEQLTRLANIQSINLESNYLSGTLPDINRLKLLTDINVRSNYLSGTIPPRYLLLPYHSLSSNYFVGEVSYKAKNRTSICPGESDVDNNCLRLKWWDKKACGKKPPQRSAESCWTFCRAASRLGTCGRRGFCVPASLRKNDSAVVYAACRCKEGAAVTADNQYCVKVTNKLVRKACPPNPKCPPRSVCQPNFLSPLGYRCACAKGYQPVAENYWTVTKCVAIEV